MAATRRDCQGSPLEPGPFGPMLTTHDLGFTCQNISPFVGQPPHRPSTYHPRGQQEVGEDVCKGECQISTFRSEIEKEKLRMR